MTGETVFVSSTGETVSSSHALQDNSSTANSISIMSYLKTHGRKPSFLKTVCSWTLAFVLLVVVNLALVMQGGKLSELATAFLVGLAIFYHYLLEPFWTNTCGKKKSDNETRKEDNKSTKAGTEEDTTAAVATEKEIVLVNVITDEEVATITTNANANEDNDNDNNNDDDNNNPTEKKKELTETEESDDSDDSTGPQQQQPAKTKRPRLLFLDNVKVFLTVLVVTHHITQGFGADRADSFYLVVGLGAPYTNSSNAVRTAMRIFVTINQSYFMPLFFFISAYFCPGSVEKYGVDKFTAGKRHRLVWPGLITFFTIIPGAMLIQMYIRQSWEEVFFVLNPGHMWFIVWLLVLCWMYTSFYQATTTTTNDDNNTTLTTHTLLPFPNTWTRMAWAACICGILQWLVVLCFVGTFLVGMIPLTFGSLTCDMFMFAMGVLAKRHKWLEMDSDTNNLATKMKIRPWVFRVRVVVEGAILIGLMQTFQWWQEEQEDLDIDTETTGETLYEGIGVPALPFSPFGLPFYFMSGIFCVDMGLVTLQFFQQYGNTQSMLSQSCAKAAYTVYLIHPVIVVAVQAAYVYGYNAVNEEEPIFFEFDPHDELTRAGQGGGYYMPLMGWAFTTVITHLIVWPLGYWLSTLPGLRTML